MAKSNWGITSGFIGKLGNVVGYNWKGINVQRALTNGSKSNSVDQQLQRARFALISRAASDLYEAIYEGYREEADKQRSTQNGLFIKYNIEQVTGSTIGTLALNYEQLQLSSTVLRGVDFGTASLAGNTLSVSISDDNLYGRRVSASDRVYLCVYCPELRDARCQAVGTRNTTTSLTLSFPDKWGDKCVFAYGFTIGAASFNEGLASDTVYLGSFGSPWSGNSGNNSGSSTGSQTGGNSGSGNETPNVTAPVISGTSPFADTTQVTLTEPEGARAYYTTDGSTPTAESTLYTAPFTLSATTTVKAIAIKDGIASPVASKTFTKSSGDNGGTTE